MSDRTFKIKPPFTNGNDVKDFQQRLKAILKDWDVDWDGFVPDGKGGPITRSVTAAVIRGFGGSPGYLLKDGITPEVRKRIRDWQDKEFTKDQRERYREASRFRKKLRLKHKDHDVHVPVEYTLDSWGWTPPIHDGVDLICAANAPLYAICKSKVVRVNDDWWGAGNPGGAKGDLGDGIIVLESMVDIGPIKKGMHFCYGHAEKPKVKVGDVVEAGRVIGHAGLANAWHIHFMVNDDAPVNGLYVGKGDRDPERYYRYAEAND